MKVTMGSMATASVQYKSTTNTGSYITFHLTKKTLVIHFFAYQNMYTESMQTAFIFNILMQVVIHNDGSRLLQH